MDDYKKYEPIFGKWYLGEELGHGSFGRVFEISREEYNTTYKAALKIIKVPQDEDDIKDRMTAGTDKQAVSEYYEGLLKEIINENELMAQLKGNSNIVSYEDHEVIPHEDGIGYDVLIRMELLKPLKKLMREKHLDEKEVVKLGADICKALEVCHRKNIIHRDIKPGNIFVSENGDFKLGDFGIARTMEKTTQGMSRKGTSRFMAPEVFKGENYDSTADIYSLGIVLYTLLNGNRGPFLPAPPAKVTHNDEEEANMRRFRGEVIPAPRDAGTMLAYIIRKACDPDPRKRYQTAEQMRSDLENYLANYNTQSVASAPMPEASAEETAAGVAPRYTAQVPRSTGMYDITADQNDATAHDISNQQARVAPTPKKRSKTWIAVAAVAAVIAVLAGVGASMGMFSRNGNTMNIDLIELMEQPTVAGYDGYGYLNDDIGVDEEKRQALLDGIPDPEQRDAVDTFLAGVFYMTYDEDLSNGDTITIVADYDSVAAKEANVSVINSETTWTVTGLAKEEVTKSGFTLGETYTVVAKEGVAVRSTPERLEKRANQIMYDELSPEYKSQAIGKSGDHAALKKGAKVVCLDMEGDWMQITDGWVCTRFDGEELIR